VSSSKLALVRVGVSMVSFIALLVVSGDKLMT
jgi:hypothetical protein